MTTRTRGWGNIRGERDPRPISPLVLFTSYHDCGPCESGSPSAFCAHCGSGGRHVWGFVCADGTRRAAMRGCLQIFPRVDGLAAQQLAAMERWHKAVQEQRRRGGKRGPTSWDSAVMDATRSLDQEEISVQDAADRIRTALGERAAWLKRRFPRRG